MGCYCVVLFLLLRRKGVLMRKPRWDVVAKGIVEVA